MIKNVKKQSKILGYTDVFAREFSLEDKEGNVINLLGEFDNTPWLYEPSNLGWEQSIDIVKSPNRDIITGVEDVYQTITGKLFFDDYSELVVLKDIIEISQYEQSVLNNPNHALKLVYKVLEQAGKQYWYVYFTSFKYSEKELDGHIEATVQIKLLSNLRSDRVIVQNNAIDPTVRFTYPLPTPNSPLIMFGEELTEEIFFQIKSNSTVDVPVKLIIDGEISNPTWINETTGVEGGNFYIGVGKFICDANIPEEYSFDGADIIKDEDSQKEQFIYLKPGINQIRVRPVAGTPTQLTQVIIEYSNEVRG